MNIVVFEDEQVSDLYPVTIGRAAYAITCGSYRLVDWLGQLPGAARGLVRPHLVQLQRLDFPQLESTLDAQQATLLVNARLVPCVSNIRQLQRLVAKASVGVLRQGTAILAAVVPPGQIPDDVDDELLLQLLGSLEFANLAPLDHDLTAFDYPHDVIRHNMRILTENLEHRIASGAYRQQSDGVFVAEGAQIGAYVVSDTSRGPIVLEAGARIGPYCFLQGPAFIGRQARVIEHAAIKDAVTLGHTTKIGGEIEASVIEPYTNKQHHGFMGHSYLGSWINLGAGTCNSDLKNTYGEVKMEYGSRKVATGMQFIGCIMGDYAKSAINTGIFTGKTIGACSMLYGFITTNVASFVNYARLFGQVTELPPVVMIPTQERMFQRRQVRQRESDIQLIHDMYRLTTDERRLAGEPLSL